MRPSLLLQSHREAIKAILARHRVRNVRVFGSVLRGEDREDSDLDLLVDPTPETTLLDIGGVQVEVSELLGVRVDVVTPAALPESWRNRIIAEARPLLKLDDIEVEVEPCK